MSGIPAMPPATTGQMAYAAGDVSTREELLACKIGGCCGKDTPLLPMDVLTARMPALPHWTLSADGKAISKEFVAKNWAAAVRALNGPERSTCPSG
jgi:hypothetical protein